MSEAEMLQGEQLPEIPQDAATDALDTEVEPSTTETVDPAEPEAPKPKGVQKRIDELTANWREEQRTRQKLEQMLEQVLADKRPPEPEPAPAAPQGEPQLDQFETYEQYVRALARFEAKQERAAWDQEQQQQTQQQQRQTLRQEFQSRVEQFKAQAPDFDRIVAAPGVAISDTMLELIEESDMGPALAYHLGQNPDLSRSLYFMTPTQAAKELGKLEAKLSLPQPKTVSNAPAPIEPLSGGGSRAIDPEKMTGDEFAAWRREQLRKK